MNHLDGLPDPERLRRLQQLLLERLAKGPDPVFAEIAEEVRSGRMTLRDAAFSPAYQETFAAAATSALRATDNRSEEAAATSLEARIAQLEAMPPPVAEPEPPEPPAAADTDDEPADSFMVGPPTADRESRPPRRERWNRRWQQ